MVIENPYGGKMPHRNPPTIIAASSDNDDIERVLRLFDRIEPYLERFSAAYRQAKNGGNDQPQIVEGNPTRQPVDPQVLIAKAENALAMLPDTTTLGELKQMFETHKQRITQELYKVLNQ